MYVSLQLKKKKNHEEMLKAWKTGKERKGVGCSVLKAGIHRELTRGGGGRDMGVYKVPPKLPG